MAVERKSSVRMVKIRRFRISGAKDTSIAVLIRIENACIIRRRSRNLFVIFITSRDSQEAQYVRRIFCIFRIPGVLQIRFEACA